MFTAKHLEKQSTKTIPDSEPPFVPQSPPLFYSGFCAITQTTVVKAPVTSVFPDLLVLFDPTDSPCFLGLLSPPVSPDLAFLHWMLLISWLTSSSSTANLEIFAVSPALWGRFSSPWVIAAIPTTLFPHYLLRDDDSQMCISG